MNDNMELVKKESKHMISIIIPIFNGEEYIERCLKSVIGQSYFDLEIICVDDGSIDDSLEMLKKWAMIDERIKIYSIENNGVSNARNFGIEKASGEYIMFLDVDDWIELDTCEDCINIVDKKNVDVIMWPYIREYKTRSLKKKVFDKDIIFENEELDALHRRFFGMLGNELQELDQADALCTVWGKLYKREIIIKNQIRFVDLKEIGSYEDGLFNIQYFAKIKRALYINHYFYHYWKENIDSITTQYNGKLIEQKRNLYLLLENEIKIMSYDNNYNIALNNRKCLDYLSLGINSLADSASFITKYKRLHVLIRDPERQILLRNFNLNNLSLCWKVFFFCIKTKNTIGYYVLMKLICELRK